MTTTWITPVNVSPSATDGWLDVDVSSYIPSSATGVIIDHYDTQVSAGPTHYRVGLRKNGSTDTLYGRQVGYSHSWAIIGVDASRIFEARLQNSAVQLWLHGYTESEAIFFTNGIDCEPGSGATWTDKDISSDTGANTAIAAIVMAGQATALDSVPIGIRKNGSTDNRKDQSGIVCMMSGCDGSEIFETYISTTTNNYTMLCVGYFTAGFTSNTNAIDVSLGSTGSYIDLTALGTGAIGACYEVIRTSGAGYGTKWNIRKDGTSGDEYVNASWERSLAIIESSSLICEAKIETTGVDMFEMGYFTPFGSTRRAMLVS